MKFGSLGDCYKISDEIEHFRGRMIPPTTLWTNQVESEIPTDLPEEMRGIGEWEYGGRINYYQNAIIVDSLLNWMFFHIGGYPNSSYGCHRFDYIREAYIPHFVLRETGDSYWGSRHERLLSMPRRSFRGWRWVDPIEFDIGYARFSDSGSCNSLYEIANLLPDRPKMSRGELFVVFEPDQNLISAFETLYSTSALFFYNLTNPDKKPPYWRGALKRKAHASLMRQIEESCRLRRDRILRTKHNKSIGKDRTTSTQFFSMTAAAEKIGRAIAATP